MTILRGLTICCSAWACFWLGLNVKPLITAASSISANTSPITWQLEGANIARENTVNFTATPDMLLIASNPAGKFQIQVSGNSIEWLSRATDQAGTDRYCRSTTGSDAYACHLNPTLLVYTPGACFVLNPDTANTGAAALDVDTLGSLPVLTHAGGTPANGDIPANLATLLCLNSDATAWSRP